MLLFKTVRPLLLAGICLCVCGTPVNLPGVRPHRDGDCSRECVGSPETRNLRSQGSSDKRVTGLPWKLGAGGGATPHEPPVGADVVTQAENEDGLDGRSGSRVAGGEVWSNRSETVGIASETRDSQRQVSSSSPPFLDRLVTPKQVRVHLDGISTPSSVSPQMKIIMGESKDQAGTEDKEQKPGWTPSSIPPLDFATPQTSTPVWDQYGPTVPSLLDPLLPDIGPNLMPKEDGPESVWTEAAGASEGKRTLRMTVHVHSDRFFKAVSKEPALYSSSAVFVRLHLKVKSNWETSGDCLTAFDC